MDYTAECYFKFMHNSDTFHDEDEAFTAKLSKQRTFVYVYLVIN